MTLEDIYRYLAGAYYGVMEMDEYDVKEFIAKKIENYIRDFLEENPIDNFDYYKEAEEIEHNVSLKNKLQDCLIVLPKINAPMELRLLVKEKLNEIREKEIEEMM